MIQRCEGHSAEGLLTQHHLIFAPQQAIVLAADAGANKVNSMILNPEVEISEPEHHPGWK